VIAFARGGGAVTAVPRLTGRHPWDWHDTILPLPPGTWQNVLTGDILSGDIPLADLLRRFPVALLQQVQHEAAG
jgi:(1->4)-alpha-D-glucan 1-alpha-D-glucosylmutase